MISGSETTRTFDEAEFGLVLCHCQEGLAVSFIIVEFPWWVLGMEKAASPCQGLRLRMGSSMQIIYAQELLRFCCAVDRRGSDGACTFCTPSESTWRVVDHAHASPTPFSHLHISRKGGGYETSGAEDLLLEFGASVVASIETLTGCKAVVKVLSNRQYVLDFILPPLHLRKRAIQ